MPPGPHMKSTSLAACSGMLLFLAAPGSFALPVLAWIALVPLLIACRQATTLRQAARLGLVAGLILFVPLLYWIVVVLGTYGQLPWFISGPAMLLLALYMSLFPAAFAGLCRLLWDNRKTQKHLLFLGPTIWVALDWVRSVLFTGFPWQDLAYSQHPYPLILQMADLAGHHGLTWLIVLSSFWVLFSLSPQTPPANQLRPSGIALTIAGLLLLACPLYGYFRIPQIDHDITQAEQRDVVVVQGNIDQSQKWRQDNIKKTLDTYFRLSAEILAAHPEATQPLVIWPETALPFSPAEAPRFADEVTAFVDNANVWLLSGRPEVQYRTSSPPRIYNRATLTSPEGDESGHYDKQHLVPFGEYIPARRLLPFLSPVVQTMADFTAGATSTPIACQNAKLGVLICFESIFPDLARQQTEQGANALVNITNDAWFGRTSAPFQHFSMAVLRAVENRRSLARAANTGISGFIDPVGRRLAASPLFTEYALHARIPLLTTPTVFSRFGHLFPTVCVVLTVACGLFSLRSRKTVHIP